MTRSKWKSPVKKIKVINNKTHASRFSEILPEFVGATFSVFNGIKNKDIQVTESMIGHKFGEFFFTRSKYIFKKKKKKKK